MAKGKYKEWLEDDKIILLQGWARQGLTNEQIAHNMGITTKTLYEWQNKYSTIRDALKKGKEVIDLMVENALLKRALGYDYIEETVEISEKDGKKVKRVNKHVAGDTTAQIFWLKNRRAEIWREKPREIIQEEKEDDGLLNALASSCDDMDDDSEFLPKEENVND